MIASAHGQPAFAPRPELSPDDLADQRRVAERRMKLVRGFAHDLRDPIGSADGYLALLEEEVHGSLSRDQRVAVASARRLLGTTLRLIEQLLDIARTGSGLLEMHPVVTNLADLTREVVDSFQPVAAARGVHLAVAIGADESVVTFRFDRERARQVVANLVSNAVKYTHAGGAVEVTQTYHADRFGARRAMVSVADTGPGISADHLGTLFDEFARFDRGAAQGSGIGLAISQRLALAMGGTIVVQSEVGRGSVFTFVLPVQEGAAPHR